MEYIKVIKEVPEIHCARGPEVCEKCQELQGKKSFCLIRVYLKATEVARPITEVYVGCRRIRGEYDVIKRFETKKEAKAYAINHKVEIVFD